MEISFTEASMHDIRSITSSFTLMTIHKTLLCDICIFKTRDQSTISQSASNFEIVSCGENEMNIFVSVIVV